jgi:hypothetical protein
MRRIFLWTALLIMSVSSACAQIVNAPQVGGTGGGGFDDVCRSGSVMVGYNMIIGKSVITFAAVCQAQTNGVLVGANYGGRTFGRNDGPGVGGTPHVMVTPRCPGGTAISGMHIWVNKFNELDSVSGTCTPLLSNTVKGATIQQTGTQGGEGYSNDSSNCPAGMIAVGITIRSGALVDALGLKCSPFPWHRH